MKTLDLLEDIPRTLDLLHERGQESSISAVLTTLGIAQAPTLRQGQEAATTAGLPGGDGLSLGRFQVQGELGRGGMGKVMAARDPELRRSVAVKIVVDPSQVTEAQLSRFVAEAQITSQLEHPNIVPVHDMGLSDDGQLYFVMKKVEGKSLGEVLAALREGEEGTLGEWGRHRLLTAFIQLCHGVAYAHDCGVLHRDLKPDNIMLGSFGEVLLVDWGVARLMGDTSERVSREAVERVTVAKTLDGAVIGTPGFMSPEQSMGRLHELDGRSDQWSLGAILYEILTLQPAYQASSLFGLMYAATSGPPQDPCERAPQRQIPPEVAAICMKAMATERGDRFGSAAELGSEIEAFLEGSKRREAALRHVAEAETAWERYKKLAIEREELRTREGSLADALPSWATLEAKEELLAVRRRLSSLGRVRVDRFEEVVFACDQALSQDPGNRETRALLARVHYARFEEAESVQDDEDQHHHEQRVRRYDDEGRYVPLLREMGSLTLRTDPPGAEVVCERYDTRADLVWPLVERRVLGTTPLEGLPLEQGSYLLTLRCPGKRDTRYPVLIPRGGHWDSGEQPLPLYSDEEIGNGMVYVPAGSFACGGDENASDAFGASEPWVDSFFISAFPVTTQTYCDFLNGLAAQDPELAWSRVPRQGFDLKDSGGQYWARPQPGQEYVVPLADQDGDRWDPLWPVSSISWADAQACVEWLSVRDGVPTSLPTEQQWEKAARGVDARIFPWGSGFDPTLCKMRESRESLPSPEVVGAFPTDLSPYLVHDLAGGVRDWCGDVGYGRDVARRPVRGGSWAGSPRGCRLAYRSEREFWLVKEDYGFRVVRTPSGADAGCS